MHVTLIHLNKKDTKHKTFTEIKQATCIASMVKRNEKLKNTLSIFFNLPANFCFFNLQNLTLRSTSDKMHLQVYYSTR